MSVEIPEFEGYTVVAQEANNPDAQTTYLVTRDSDGTGLGAYASPEGVEVTIQQDLATAEQRANTTPQLDVGVHGNPLVRPDGSEPPQEPDGTRVATPAPTAPAEGA